MFWAHLAHVVLEVGKKLTGGEHSGEGHSGGTRQLPEGDFTYSIGVIHPDDAALFARNHPDAVLAIELHRHLLQTSGYSECVNHLLQTIKRKQVESPGYIVVCFNFS